MENHSSKKLILLYLLVFLQITLFAQPTLTFGPDNKMEAATYPVKHLLSNAEGHYYTTFNAIGIGICKFNKDLSLEFQKELRASKSGLKTVDIFGAGKNVYLLANKKITKGDNHYDYYLYTIDKEGDYTNERLLFEYADVAGNQPISFVHHSPDSSKIAILTYQDKDSDKLKFNLNIIVLNKEGDVIWNMDYHYKYSQKALGALEFAVDNDGIVYAHTIDFSDDKKYINHITRFSNDESKKAIEIRPELGTSFIIDSKLLTNKDGECYFVGSYSENKDWMGSGFFYMSIAKDGSISQPLTLTPVSREMLSKLEKANVVFKKKERSGFHENVVPRRLYERINGDVVAHFENTSIKGLGITIGNPEITIVSKEDLICIFNKKGSVTSFFVAPKNQNCDYDRFAHRYFDLSNNSFASVNNDHHENVGSLTTLKKYSSSGGTKTGYFDTKGIFSQNHISNEKELKDYNLITESICDLGNNKTLFVLINNSYSKPKARLVMMDSSKL